jgi:hypothetical protein
MLKFFRRYQKTLFAVVAVFTTASFLFFGSYSVMQSPARAVDYPIGKTIDGKNFTAQQLQLLVRFLNTSSFEGHLFEKGLTPNLLNDGVVQKDFLETGFAAILAERFLEPLKQEQEKKLEKIKQFRLYQHPAAPFLSVKNLWENFAPGLLSDYQALLEKQEMDAQAFSLLCSLYLEQTKISPDLVRQVLHSQQSQFEWLSKDPFLERGDLSLFNFHTMEDWLGRRFLTLIAETILNGAALALQEGYQVSLAEARASLKENLHEALLKVADRKLSPQEMESCFRRQIGELFWNEEEVIENWRKVLLFRKSFEDFGQHIVIDSQTLEQSANFAAQMVQVDLFRLPSEIELKTFRDLLKLQIYLDAVIPAQTKKSKHLLLSLPLLFASPKEVEKEHPELVEIKFDVEWQEVTQRSLTEKVALKEAYQRQLSDQHWDELKKQFPALRNSDATTIEERHALLAKIPLVERAEIDLFTKKKIVQDHPDWLDEAFAKAAKKRTIFGLRSRGGDLPFKGLIDHDELKAHLEKASLGSPFSYSPDGEHHYRITVLADPGPLEIILFGTARFDGTLDLLLDRYLSQIYPEIRKKHPALFALKEGGYKPLKEVQDFVGAEAIAEVLHSIEEESRHYGVTWTDSMKNSLDLFARYRFTPFMHQMRDALINGAPEEKIVRQDSSSQPLLTNQWNLIKQEKTLERKEAVSEHLEKIFDEKENTWSQPYIDETYGPHFYHVKQKVHHAAGVQAMMDKRRELLALDAKRALFADLIEKMSGKGILSASKDLLEGLEKGE